MTEVPQQEAVGRYLDAAPDAIIVVDSDGRIGLANDRATELFGYDRSDLTGRPIEDLVPEGERRSHVSQRSGYMAHPRARHMGDPRARLRARTADGSLVPVEIALSPVPDGDSVIAVIRDVTDRVAAEAEHEGIRRSLDAVTDAVFMFDPATLEFTYVNAGAAAQTGYRRVELLEGMTPLHLAPGYNDVGLQRLMLPLLNESRTSLTFETTFRTKEGTDVPVEIVLSWPKTSVDLARPMVAIVRDITSRHEAERRLRESESAFRSAFDDAAVPMAILKLDDLPRHRIERANDALAELLGYSITELAGMDEAELTHRNDQAVSGTRTAELVAGGRSFRMEKRYRRADGSHCWVVADASLIEASHDDRRALVHITDITRRIEAEHDRDRREDLLVTLASVRKATLDEAPIDDVLRLVVSGSIEALEGLAAVLLSPGPGGRLEVRARTGPPELSWFADAVADEPLADQLLKTGESRKLDMLEHGSYRSGPVVLSALRTANSVEGLLAVSRGSDRQPFSDDDLEVTRSLAAEAAVSLVLAKARDDRRRMLLIEDRERIARDLHDVVIQRLFAAGMRLQAATNRSDLLQERSIEVIRDLDETIAEIRNSIFDLTQPDESVSGEIKRIVERHRALGRNEVDLIIDDGVERLGPETVDQLLPVVSELLSNVERHANASRVGIEVTLDDERLIVTVTDDGVGLANGPSPGFGLRNLRRRAGAVGGQFDYGSGPNGSGTRSVWSVPVPNEG